MTSDGSERGFVEGVRRFFRLPGQAAGDPAPVVPLAQAWLFCLAFGAFMAAIGWGDQVLVMALVTVLALLDDVTKGVRYRHPAFGGGLLVGWAAGRLAHAAIPAPDDPDWADYPGLAVGTLAAFVTFAAITRLRPRGR
ncbi:MULTISPECIES: hypothetical protein [unclassified Streptomyces]|uniref:hypothetical protein n=1 Tax=unclassified Streptomyces TaxID=2593676 RepID=UPI0033AAAADC